MRLQLVLGAFIIIIMDHDIQCDYLYFLAEENTKFIHNLTYNSSKDHTQFLKENVLWALGCVAEVVHKLNVSCIVINETLSIMTVEIFYITRSESDNDETNFTFRFSGLTYSFNLKVYAKPANPTCQKTISSSEFTISCFTDKIYPAAVCYTPFTKEKYSISYDSKEYTVNGVRYYRTECELTIPITNETIGMNNVSLFMYPNITNTINDSQYGVNYNFTIDVDPSVFLSQEIDFKYIAVIVGCNLLMIIILFLKSYKVPRKIKLSDYTETEMTEIESINYKTAKSPNTNRRLPDIPTITDQQTEANDVLYSDVMPESEISNSSMTHESETTTVSVITTDVISEDEMENNNVHYFDIDKCSQSS